MIEKGEKDAVKVNKSEERCKCQAINVLAVRVQWNGRAASVCFVEDVRGGRRCFVCPLYLIMVYVKPMYSKSPCYGGVCAWQGLVSGRLDLG